MLPNRPSHGFSTAKSAPLAIYSESVADQSGDFRELDRFEKIGERLDAAIAAMVPEELRKAAVRDVGRHPGPGRERVVVRAAISDVCGVVVRHGRDQMRSVQQEKADAIDAASVIDAPIRAAAMKADVPRRA